MRKDKLVTFLKFFLPFGIWCLLFAPMLSGRAVISSETLHIYSVVKFYVDNLKLGVLPLWEPFVLWGEPTQIFFNYVGVFNPLWLFTAALNLCGVSFYHAFLFSISVYFWLGLFGFYLVAKILLKDRRAAYVAFLLFLFSSTSMSMFAQFHAPLIYVPSIWFFYFLLSFFHGPSKKNLAGLTLTAALILTSYLPFYFLTVFIIVGIISGVFYWPVIKAALPSVSKFIRTQTLALVLSMGVVLLSFMPGYLAYLSTVHQDVVAPFRNGDVERRVGVDFVEYDRVALNGLTSRMELSDLYSNLDLIQYGDDCFFYISIFFYLILIMSFWLPVNKIMAGSGLTAVILFLLILTSGTGFHRFIFEHVTYFKLIRNMHFFLPFLMGAVSILAAEQLRVLFERRTELSQRYRPAFWALIVIVHVGIAAFLIVHENILGSSYIALGVSFLFWLAFLHKKIFGEVWLGIFLLLGILVQPVEVIAIHNHKALSAFSWGNKALIEQSVRAPSARPVFSYTRPISDRQIGNDDTAYSRITMTDASRFYEVGFPTFWSYDLTLKASFRELQQYTQYKFHVYDSVGTLEAKTNFSIANAVTGPSRQLQVRHFDANSLKIRTNYSGEKFLVYTDSYHKDWKASINGQAVPIVRVNAAFKGIALPAGANEIDLRYAPPGVAVTSIALIFVLLSVLGVLLWVILCG